MSAMKKKLLLAVLVAIQPIKALAAGVDFTYVLSSASGGNYKIEKMMLESKTVGCVGFDFSANPELGLTLMSTGEGSLLVLAKYFDIHIKDKEQIGSARVKIGGKNIKKTFLVVGNAVTIAFLKPDMDKIISSGLSVNGTAVDKEGIVRLISKIKECIKSN